jgi:hypothetical protein
MLYLLHTLFVMLRLLNIVNVEGMHRFTGIANVFDYEESYKGELIM